MALSTIDRRLEIYLRSLLDQDGGPSLTADKATFLTSVSAGALIATLSQPFGPGTTYAAIGSVPAPLALASGGRIVAGVGAATAGTAYEVKVRATSADGRREVAETLSFAARAGIVPLPTITLSGAQAKVEGNSGTTTYTYTVTRSASAGAIQVAWALTLLTADTADLAPGQALTGSVALADGQASATITIAIAGDTAVEGDESFALAIAVPAGYLPGAALVATGTILNDDLPTVTISAAQARAEGNSGTTAYTYTVTRSATAGAVAVPWTFAAGATDAGDYTGGVLPAGGTVALAAGQASGTFTIGVAGDTAVEPDEGFTVAIGVPTGYAAGATLSATGTILNDDVASTVVEQGRSATYDAGTAGDFFVSPNGSDTAAGTSAAAPFATVTRAIAAAKAAGGGRTVRVMAGRYREDVLVTGITGTTKASPFRIASYGTDRPVITGGNLVTGLQPCTSADQALVGPNYASIYKATIAMSSLSHRAFHALLLTEADVPLDLVQRRAVMDDLFVLDDYKRFYRRDADATVAFGTRTERQVVTRTRGLADGKDVLPSATVSAIVAVNAGGTWNGSAFEGGTTYVAGTDYVLDSAANVSWAPAGAEPAAGSTYTVVYDRQLVTTISHPAVLGSYTDAQLAASSVAIHVAPNLIAVVKVASATNGVVTLATDTYEADASAGGQKYALINTLRDLSVGRWGYRDNGDGTLTLYVWPTSTANLGRIEIAARDRAMGIRSSGFVQVDGLAFAQCASDLDAGGRPLHLYQCPDVLVSQVEVFNFSHQQRGYGGIVVENCHRARLDRYTVRNGQSSAGVFMMGYSAANPTFDNRLLYGRHERTTQTPVRWFGQQRFCDYYSLDVACGAGAHANQHIAYQGCDKGVFFGFRAQGIADGFGSCQASSRLAWINCAFGLSTDGRGLYDQIGGSQPVPGASNYVLNCAVPHDPARVAAGYAGIMVGSPVQANSWILRNNVAPGIAPRDGSLSTLTRDGNLLTKGAAANASEATVTPLDLYYDAGAGLETVPGSVVLSRPGGDVATLVAEVESWLSDPDLNLRRDLLGRAWDPADPGNGPYGKAWPIAADTTAPTLSGVSTQVAGAVATVRVTTGERGGTIFWARLPDGATTPTAAQVALGLTAGDTAALSAGSVAVAAAGEYQLSVAGTTGQTSRIAIVHRDRHGNLSSVAVASAAYGEYVGTWVAFDGTRAVTRTGALTGAVAATRSMLLAVSISRPAGTLATPYAGGIMTGTPSGSAQIIDATNTGKFRAKIKDTGGSSAFDNTTNGGAVSADVRYMVLFAYTSDAAGGRTGKHAVIDLSNGTPVGSVVEVKGADAAITFSNFTALTLLKLPASVERYMLWDNATADLGQAAGRELFVKAAGGLVDPQVAIAALGTPLIAMVGAGLAGSAGTGPSNTGRGGAFSIS